MPTADLNVSRVAIGSGYDVISDEVPELGAEGAVEGTARFGLPLQTVLGTVAVDHRLREDLLPCFHCIRGAQIAKLEMVV